MTDEMSYAKWYKRLAAVCMDTCIGTVFFLVSRFTFSILPESLYITKEAQDLILNVLVLGYYVIFKSVYQATIGMMLMKIKITDQAGAPPTTHRIFLREVLIGPVCILTIGIGLIMAMWTKKRQTLYDMLTRTLIVDAR